MTEKELKLLRKKVLEIIEEYLGNQDKINIGDIKFNDYTGTESYKDTTETLTLSMNASSKEKNVIGSWFGIMTVNKSNKKELVKAFLKEVLLFAKREKIKIEKAC